MSNTHKKIFSSYKFSLFAVQLDPRKSIQLTDFMVNFRGGRVTVLRVEKIRPLRLAAKQGPDQVAARRGGNPLNPQSNWAQKINRRLVACCGDLIGDSFVHYLFLFHENCQAEIAQLAGQSP